MRHRFDVRKATGQCNRLDRVDHRSGVNGLRDGFGSLGRRGSSMPEEAAERASFMNLLARHPDARLRAAAAGEQT